MEVIYNQNIVFFIVNYGYILLFLCFWQKH